MINSAIGLRPTGIISYEKGKAGEEAHESGKFHNLVLDVGKQHLLDRCPGLNPTFVPPWLYLGTGTTEPTPADTGLENISPTLSALEANEYQHSHGGTVGADDGIGWSAVTMRFDYGEGVAAGTWTELGVAYDDAYTKPYNRSLVRDENGTPYSITVLADEWLRVYVELRMYFPTYSRRGTFLLNGVEKGYTYRLSTDKDSLIGDSDDDSNFWLRGIQVHLTFGNFRTWSDGQGTQFFDGDDFVIEWPISRNPGSYIDSSSFEDRNSGNTERAVFITGILDEPMVKLETEKLTGKITARWRIAKDQEVYGQVTGATANTMSDSTQSWVVDEWIGYLVTVVGGIGAGQTRAITGNTADTLTLDQPWETQPTSPTSHYEITENG